MKFRGVQTNIAIQVFVLLVLAMVLIDFTVIASTQRILQDHVKSKGQLAVRMVLSAYPAWSEKRELPSGYARALGVDQLGSQGAVSCMMLADRSGNPVWITGKGCPAQRELERAVELAIETRGPVTRYSDATWGVFWKQQRYCILADVLTVNTGVVAGAGVVLSFESVYQRLRRVQLVGLLYILFNAGLLTIVGLLGLSHVTLKPIKRLAKRADEFNVHDSIFIQHVGQTNEFKKLSAALNSMLQRISTDQKKLETTIGSLEKANLDLKNAQKDVIRAEKFAAIGKLSTGLAHEIGNPIGIVIGYLDLLAQTNWTDTEKEEYIRRAQTELNRVNALVRQLLALSRDETVPLSPVSVHPVIQDIARVLEPQPMMSGIRLSMDLTAPDDKVLADRDQLRQVFLNLLINAADAIHTGGAPEKGRVHITTRPVEGMERLRIQVADNGPGIPEALLETVFDPFYTSKDPGLGTGLGLAVSYRIVHGFGGTIVAQSRPGDGTTITIELPVSPTTGTGTPGKER